MKTYKYTDSTNNVVHIIDADGVSRSSCIASILPAGTVIAAADPVVQQPNIAGFIANIKTALGGIVAVNALMKAYPAFSDALNMQEWQDVSALLVDAKTTGAITVAQYAQFQTALTANHIPVTLP